MTVTLSKAQDGVAFGAPKSEYRSGYLSYIKFTPIKKLCRKWRRKKKGGKKTVARRIWL